MNRNWSLYSDLIEFNRLVESLLGGANSLHFKFSNIVSSSVLSLLDSLVNQNFEVLRVDLTSAVRASVMFHSPLLNTLFMEDVAIAAVNSGHLLPIDHIHQANAAFLLLHYPEALEHTGCLPDQSKSDILVLVVTVLVPSYCVSSDDVSHTRTSSELVQVLLVLVVIGSDWHTSIVGYAAWHINISMIRFTIASISSRPGCFILIPTCLEVAAKVPNERIPDARECLLPSHGEDGLIEFILNYALEAFSFHDVDLVVLGHNALVKVVPVQVPFGQSRVRRSGELLIGGETRAAAANALFDEEESNSDGTGDEVVETGQHDEHLRQFDLFHDVGIDTQIIEESGILSESRVQDNANAHDYNVGDDVEDELNRVCAPVDTEVLQAFRSVACAAFAHQ